LDVIPGVVDELIEGRGFRCAFPIVLEFLLYHLPRVAPEHAGWLGKLRLGIEEKVQSVLRRIFSPDDGMMRGL